MAKFITGEELTEEVYDIIHGAKKQLLIVSPYIKLDDYFKDQLFNTHKKNSELHIIVAFGKNQKNPERSFKLIDLEYFMDFPNVSIVFIPNLHAKYYANEKKGIITSINLYDYSFKNNVEFGVVSESKLIGGSGVDKDAWESTMKVLKDGYTVYIRRPNYKKKFFIAKDYLGSETSLDLTQDLLNGITLPKHSVFDFMGETFIEQLTNPKRISRAEFDEQKKFKDLVQASNKKGARKLSATNLGKLKNKSFSEVVLVMLREGYILNKSSISEKGFQVGISYMENKKGNKWVVYPESLAELL